MSEKGGKMNIPSVGIIAFPEINPFLFSIPHCIFGLQLPDKLFNIEIATINNVPVNMTASISIIPTCRLSQIEKMNVIIIPGWPDFERKPDKQLIKILKMAHVNGALIIGLCYGAYPLAYSGLLDGRQATTHWLAEEDFTKRFPKTILNGNSLYIEDNRVITSAGSTAGIDCCIYVLHKIYGYRTANAAARLMVSAPYREGGQAQFINIPVNMPCEQNIHAITDFLNANISEKYTLDELAKIFAMSRRTLIRRFEQATGMSVKKWLVNLRLKKCCELLEASNWSIEKIAEETGFGTAALLRHHFTRKYHIPPQNWRERFFNAEPSCHK